MRFSACLILALAVGVSPVRGDVSENNVFANILRPIPDGNSLGIEDVRTIVSDIASITSVQVHVTVAGDYNGDLYGYLSHGSGLTVLLNRPGRTSANPFGYSDCGVDVTFSDAAPNDIHNYRQFVTPPVGSPVTGTWQPDARFVDPSLVMDYSPRTTFLSEFVGLNPAGSWVLFLADMDPGGTNMLVSWTLQITGTPKTQPALTWATPADITYGTALGAAQLNAAVGGVPGTFVYSPPAGTVLGAGSGQSLSVTFLPNDTNNYASVTAGVLLNVVPIPLTVTGFNTSRTYGSSNPSLSGSITGLQNGDNIIASFSTSATVNSLIGSYAIVPVFSDPHGSLVNYTVSTNPGVLLVTPATLTVTADNFSRAYGAANPPFTYQVSGFVNGDTLASVVTGSPTLGTSATATSPVGNYPITPTLGTLSAANYTFGFASGTLAVTAAPLTGLAGNSARPYGAPNPVFTVSYSGFVNGEDASVVTGGLEGFTTAQMNSPVGVYPVRVWGQTSPNYQINFVPGNLTVEPAPLVVQANDASQVVGQNNPAFSATFEGFANGDSTNVLGGTLAFYTPADASSPVGSYPIEPSGLTATNYTLIYSNGTLRVCAFGLVVTPDNQVRTYGAANPQLTGSLAGLQPGDTITAAYTTAANAASPVGNYSITASLADPNGDLAKYSVTTNIGILTVARATLTVSSDNQSRAYRAANPPLTGTLTGQQNGDNITVTFTTVADTNALAGPYPIVPVFSDPNQALGNYLVATNLGILTVTPLPLVVTADNQTRAYGAANPPFTGSMSGLQNGDTITASFTSRPVPTPRWVVTLSFRCSLTPTAA